jgi:hypothetical protein
VITTAVGIIGSVLHQINPMSTEFAGISGAWMGKERRMNGDILNKC